MTIFVVIMLCVYAAHFGWKLFKKMQLQKEARRLTEQDRLSQKWEEGQNSDRPTIFRPHHRLSTEPPRRR